MTIFDDFLNSASDAEQESWFADKGSEMQKALHKPHQIDPMEMLTLRALFYYRNLKGTVPGLPCSVTTRQGNAADLYRRT